MEEDLKAQAQVWKCIYGFTESFTLKCAVELGIADILEKHGQPMTLSELASSLPIPSINPDRFYRVMRYLVHMKLFDLVDSNDSIEKYSLTPESRLLVKTQDQSFVPFFFLRYYELDVWHYMSVAVEDGDITPWEKCHGIGYMKYLEKDSEANQLFNDTMTSQTSMVTDALVKGLKKINMFDGVVGSLIDVGGNTGIATQAIAKAFPNIRCAVLDLPHVIANAPEFPEVNRIEGDMFVSIPKTDVVFIKSVLHDWGDEDCVKILKKCKEAIPEKGGKVVIVDIVMDMESSTHEWTCAKLGMDMDMLVNTNGKERTKAEWEKLFKLAGFIRYEITPIIAMESIIQVIP